MGLCRCELSILFWSNFLSIGIMWLVYPRDWEFLYPSPTFHSQRNFNFHKWLTCNFPLWYPYLIQQTDNENTLTYQVEAIILILPQILKLNEYQINPVRWLINDCKYMKIICVNCGWTKGIWKWPSQLWTLLK